MAGPIPFEITVNGENFTIVRTRDDINPSWADEQSANSTLYSISGNTVVWGNGGILQLNSVDVLPTDEIDNTSYTTRAATSRVSVDLTTLPGWSALSDGEHTVQIVAKGTGYRDSAKSTSVTVTKAAQAYTDCITFTGETSDFTLKATYKEWDGTLQWSTDHNTWTTLTGTETIQSVNKKIYLRGKGNTRFYTSYGARLSLSAKAGCSGNIQTLLDWENPPTIINRAGCYRFMFYKCTNLTTAPELPATTLADRCYSGMFSQCTNLTSAPDLPAVTLATRCYSNMFDSCASFTISPELHATILAEGCYENMFSGCTNLTTAPALPVTTLANYCYSYMFFNCTSLTAATELPATTLVEGCYYGMFSKCTNLKVNTSSGNKIFTCPDAIPSLSVEYMFDYISSVPTGTPTAGNTYYWE